MGQFFQPVFDIKFNSLSTTYLQMLTSVLKGYTTVILLLQCVLTRTLGSTVPALMDTQAMEHTAKV